MKINSQGNQIMSPDNINKTEDEFSDFKDLMFFTLLNCVGSPQ